MSSRISGFLLLMSWVFAACQADKGKMLVKNWKLEEDSTVIFEVNPDSTFTYLNLEGKWDLSADRKWLILKNQTRSGEEAKNIEIKELTSRRMVLSDNGDEIIFVSAGE